MTEDSTAFREYGEMIKVAVHTAQQYTSLEPHLLYEGGENELTAWLRDRGTRIIRHRSRFREGLAALGRKKGNPHLEAALSGAFSRVELPEIVERLGGPERVLYTDCDVIFTGEIVPELKANRCEYFAVAPESTREDYVNMNTGVMLMNVHRLRETWPKFRDYIGANLFELEKESWDEAAYRWFYRDASGPLWDKLRPELNWKPYWGENPEAKLIHLHGPKPYQRDHIASTWPELKPYTGGAFEATVERWRQLLRECR